MNKTESEEREEKRKEENKIIADETDVIYQKIKEKINIPLGVKLVESLKNKNLLIKYYILLLNSYLNHSNNFLLIQASCKCRQYWFGQMHLAR